MELTMEALREEQIWKLFMDLWIQDLMSKAEEIVSSRNLNLMMIIQIKMKNIKS